MQTFITLFVIFAAVYFAGKLILQRAGRPTTKVYNVVTPLVYQMPPHYSGPPQFMYPEEAIPTIAEPGTGNAASEDDLPDELPSEDKAFYGLVREYYRP